MVRAGLLLACLSACGPARAASEFEFARFAKPPEFARALGICAAVPAPAVPAPKPPFPACDETELYYGFGRPADPVAARACALMHLALKPPIRPTKSFSLDVDLFGGAAMLATLAANGAGTPRDLDAAIGFACRIDVLEDMSPRDVASMIEDFAKRRADPARRETPFELCALPVSDNLASTCEGAIAFRKRRQVQATRIEALAKTLGRPAQAALRAVRVAYGRFTTASFEIERRLASDVALRAAWRADADGEAHIVDLAVAAASSQIPPASPADAAATDATLVRAFAAAMRPAAGGDDDMRRKDVRHDQALWRAYRAAFLAFASRVAPRAPTDGLAIILTKERIAEIEAMRRERIITDPHGLEDRGG